MKEKSKIPMKKAGITLFCLLIILILFLLTVRGCSMRKKVDTETPNTNIPKQEEVVNNTTTNNSNKGVKKEDSSLEEKETSVKEEKEDMEKVVEDSNSEVTFSKLNKINLGESKEVDALVSKKSIYKVSDTSIAYNIDLLIPYEDNYHVVKYFCPKKTYDGLESGVSVKATYQVDENGLISISSLSK